MLVCIAASCLLPSLRNVTAYGRRSCRRVQLPAPNLALKQPIPSHKQHKPSRIQLTILKNLTSLDYSSSPSLHAPLTNRMCFTSYYLLLAAACVFAVALRLRILPPAATSLINNARVFDSSLFLLPLHSHLTPGPLLLLPSLLLPAMPGPCLPPPSRPCMPPPRRVFLPSRVDQGTTHSSCW
jgi:hypothetical protein